MSVVWKLDYRYWDTPRLLNALPGVENQRASGEKQNKTQLQLSLVSH